MSLYRTILIAILKKLFPNCSKLHTKYEADSIFLKKKKHKKQEIGKSGKNVFEHIFVGTQIVCNFILNDDSVVIFDVRKILKTICTKKRKSSQYSGPAEIKG